MRCAASLLLVTLLAGCGEERVVVPRLIAKAEAAKIAPVTSSPAAQRYEAEGYASWYGDEFADRPTANGEIFEPEALTAAHRTLPLPSWLEVEAADTGKTLIVRVNDRGPYANERLIDLSQGAARELGLSGNGHSRVRIRRVSLDDAQFAAFRADEQARKARRMAAITPVAMPDTDASGHLYVQLATFAGRHRAVGLAERSGARMESIGALHRVRFGPFADDATANEALRAAAARGYPEGTIIQD